MVQCSILNDDAKLLRSATTQLDCGYLHGAFISLGEDRAARRVSGNDMSVSSIDLSSVGVRCAHADHPVTERFLAIQQGTGFAQYSAELAWISKT